MAWTKVKTAVVVGVAVIAAASTTGVMIQTHHHNYNKPLPENSWANAGSATPEAAFQTALWAARDGNVKSFEDSFTTAFGEQFMQTAGQGKSDAELTALFKQIADKIGSFQVESKEQTAPGEVVLHLRCRNVANGTVPLKEIRPGWWKISGNIVFQKDTVAGDVRQ